MDPQIKQTVAEAFNKAYNQGLDHSIQVIKAHQGTSSNPLLDSIIKSIEGLAEYQNSAVHPTILNSLKAVTP